MFLQDTYDFINHFTVRSENRGSEYTIAQNKKTGQWACSCMGSRIYGHSDILRKLKHSGFFG